MMRVLEVLNATALACLLGLAGAARRPENRLKWLKDLDGDVDCSHLKPAPAWVKIYKEYYEFDEHTFWRTDLYSDCGQYFIFFDNGRYGGRYVRLQESKDHGFCMVQSKKYVRRPGGFKWEDMQNCDIHKGSFATQILPDMCKDELCHLAKTGQWKAGWFKQTKARKIGWIATMPGHKSIGYEEAFNLKCLHGGQEGYSYVPLNFTDFAKKYDLITASKTFNKLACQCKTASYWSLRSRFRSRKLRI